MTPEQLMPEKTPAVSPSAAARTYQVQLGHVTVRVEGATPEEALRAARHAMSCEFPRLWDVIHRAENGRFQIRPTE